jgi:hypothetical protein
MMAIAEYSVPPLSHMNRFTVTPQHITLSEGRQLITHILWTLAFIHYPGDYLTAGTVSYLC